MQKKQNGMFLIFGILSLLIAGYSLFITVFEQIISQNEGFFYTIVFGGILILVYVSINLICRLMNVSNEIHSSKGIDITCAILLIILCILYGVWRTSYSISLSPHDTVFWGSAELLSNNALSVSSDMVQRLCDDPAYFPMALLYAILINIPADPVKIITFTNAVFYCGCALFIYYITKHFTDHLCGLYSALGCLFLPTHIFYVNLYTSDAYFAFIFTLCLFLSVKIISASSKGELSVSVVLYVLFMGILMLSEPTMVIFAVLLSICLVAAKQNNSKAIMLASFVSIFLFLILTLAKSAILNINVSVAFKSILQCFSPISAIGGEIKNFTDAKNIFDLRIAADNFVIENNFGTIIDRNSTPISALSAAWFILFNEIMFMMYAVMCISAAVSAIQNKDLRAIFVMSSMVAAAVTIFMQSPREGVLVYYHCIMSLFGGFGLFYIYLNHHPEEQFFWCKIYGAEAFEAAASAAEIAVAEQEENEIDKMAFLMRANALIFPGENQNLYSAIKIEERSNAIISADRDDDVVMGDSSSDNTVSKMAEIDDVFETVYDAEVIEPREDIYSNDSEGSSYYDSQDIQAYDASDVPDESISAPDEEPVTYLHNPLPVPVRKPHTKIDFDFDVSSEDDDWDVDYTDIHLKEFDH